MENDFDDINAVCAHGNYYNQVECEECIDENEIPEPDEEE